MVVFVPSCVERSGVATSVKILSIFNHNLDTTNLKDPEVIIKIDISNSFNSSRDLTLDILSGRSSRDYPCGLKRGDNIPTCDNLTDLFGYFKTIHTYHTNLRSFDWDGQVHLTKGKTGGHQGDPLEMFIF